MGKRLEKIKRFWNSPIEIRIFNFRQVQQQNNGLPRSETLDCVILDQDERKLTKVGNSTLISQPEGWLKLVAKDNDHVLTQLRRIKDTNKHVILIEAIPEIKQ